MRGRAAAWGEATTGGSREEESRRREDAEASADEKPHEGVGSEERRPGSGGLGLGKNSKLRRMFILQLGFVMD